jgi:hypothetical protein
MPYFMGRGNLIPDLAADDSSSDAHTRTVTEYFVGGFQAREEPTASGQFRDGIG